MVSLSIESSSETFTKKFSMSRWLTAEGRRYIPGGYSRSSFDFGPHAIFVEEADGAYLRTIEGHRLLDLNNNFTVNVLGHNHPAITKALHETISSGISFGNPSRVESDLARVLVNRVPSVEKVQFSCSATESCMSAVRIARAHTGRTKVAKVEGGYHGFSDVLHISSHTQPGEGGDDSNPVPVADSAGIPAENLEETVILSQNDRSACERILRANAGQLSCLILELQSGSGGLVPLDYEFVSAIRELTNELGIVLVFDETISLRAGYHGLQGVYDVTPDLTVMGKIIGGGLPLGAVGGAASIMDILETGPVTISGTHHGHRLALAAGAACMRELDKSALERLNRHASQISSELNKWSKARNSPFAIYGRSVSHLAYGYMSAPGLQVQNHRDYWHSVDQEKTQLCSLELANRGFFPVHRGEISLSTPMTDEDIHSFIETTKNIVVDIET